MCIHCLQAVGVASEHQNSLQHQYAGLYDSPNIDNAQKVCKHLYVVTTYVLAYQQYITYV